jgi:hypothetical protein
VLKQPPGLRAFIVEVRERPLLSRGSLAAAAMTADRRTSGRAAAGTSANPSAASTFADT